MRGLFSYLYNNKLAPHASIKQRFLKVINEICCKNFLRRNRVYIVAYNIALNFKTVFSNFIVLVQRENS